MSFEEGTSQIGGNWVRCLQQYLLENKLLLEINMWPLLFNTKTKNLFYI